MRIIYKKYLIIVFSNLVLEIKMIFNFGTLKQQIYVFNDEHLTWDDEWNKNIIIVYV